MLVHTLPNGLGIYRTPFIDQDGSQLAYGGPHQIFSRGRSKSYNKLMGGLLDRTMSRDPMVPELDCSLVLQVPMGLPGDNGSCFYPTPLEQETISDQQTLEYHDPVEKNQLFSVREP